MRQLARDPFARHSLVRETIRPLRLGQTCDFCGNVRTTPRMRTPFLYRYGTEPDVVRPRIHWHSGAFCSRPCHDAYHS